MLVDGCFLDLCTCQLISICIDLGCIVYRCMWICADVYCLCIDYERLMLVLLHCCFFTCLYVYVKANYLYRVLLFDATGCVIFCIVLLMLTDFLECSRL